MVKKKSAKLLKNSFSKKFTFILILLIFALLIIGTSGLFSSSKFSGYSIFDWLFKTRAKVPSQSTQTFSSETQPIQVTPQALSGNCDDNNPCTKDDCISTTQPTSQPVPSLTIVATQSATSQPCTCVYTNLADGTPCSGPS